QDVLVHELGRAVAVGAFLDDVVDAAQEGIRRALELAEAEEGTHLADEARVCRRQYRLLLGEIRQLPGGYVAEEARRLVVGVVAGRQHGKAARQRGAIEMMPLERAARGARRAARRLRDGRNAEPVLGLVECDDLEAQPALLGEHTRLLLGCARVGAD